MKGAVVFAFLSVVLFMSASISEWKLPVNKPATVAYKKATPEKKVYAYKKSPPLPSNAPVSPHYGIAKEKPIHERSWFVVLKEWIGLLANFIQTIGGVFSGLVAIVLWRKNRRLEMIGAS